VVQRGVNEDEALPLAAFAREGGHVLRFIEYMDVGTCNGWRRDAVVPSAELRDRLHARWPLRPLDPNYRGEVAARYAYADGGGEVGFVGSVTAPFCGDCHRARVSADGTLYTCLFAAQGQPLRATLQQGEGALVDALAQAWTRRADRYSEIRGAANAPKRHVEMYLVGG
jgi:cyclic pyranopterin phosphate synthase